MMFRVISYFGTKLCSLALIFALSLTASAQEISEQPIPKLVPDIETQISEQAEEIKPPEVLRDLQSLPFPVRRMRELILEATTTGDIEKLRPLLGIGENATLLTLGETIDDPIDQLKELSGDEKGHEILAILEEVLQAGFARVDEGTDQELFIWPYFFSHPLDQLSERQMVELFRIVTYGDYLDMKDFGGYIFYRVGISPRGQWRFFVAGD